MPPKRQLDDSSQPKGVEFKRQKLDLQEQPDEQTHRLDTLPREHFELIMSFCSFQDWIPFDSVCKSLRKYWKAAPAGILATTQAKLHRYLCRTSEPLCAQLSYKSLFKEGISVLFTAREAQVEAQAEEESTTENKQQTLENLKDYPHLHPFVNRITKLWCTDEDDYHHDTLIWYGGRTEVCWGEDCYVNYLHKTLVTGGAGDPDDEARMSDGLLEKLGLSEEDFLILWNKGFPRGSLWRKGFEFEMEYFNER